MTSELKPCPFCGEDEIALHPRDLARWGCELPHNGNDAQYAHCDRCGAEGPQSFYEHEAIDAWNRRSTISKATA